MSTTTRRRASGRACALIGCLWLALSVGCGGAARPEASTAPSNAGGAPKYQSIDRRGGDQPSPGYPPPPATAPTATSPSVVPEPPMGRAEAMAELDRAQRELGASAGDCATACRALASLERATVRLCELAEQADDVHRCEDAKRKLRSARERVRSTCTSCPGGPSVDRDAPIPSR